MSSYVTDLLWYLTKSHIKEQQEDPHGKHHLDVLDDMGEFGFYSHTAQHTNHIPVSPTSSAPATASKGDKSGYIGPHDEDNEESKDVEKRTGVVAPIHSPMKRGISEETITSDTVDIPPPELLQQETRRTLPTPSLSVVANDMNLSERSPSMTGKSQVPIQNMTVTTPPSSSSSSSSGLKSMLADDGMETKINYREKSRGWQELIKQRRRIVSMSSSKHLSDSKVLSNNDDTNADCSVDKGDKFNFHNDNQNSSDNNKEDICQRLHDENTSITDVTDPDGKCVCDDTKIGVNRNWSQALSEKKLTRQRPSSYQQHENSIRDDEDEKEKENSSNSDNNDDDYEYEEDGAGLYKGTMESLRSKPTRVDESSDNRKADWQEAIHTRRYSGKETTSFSSRQTLNVLMNAPSPSLVVSTPPERLISSSMTRDQLENDLDEEGTQEDERKGDTKGVPCGGNSTSEDQQDVRGSSKTLDEQRKLDSDSNLVNTLQESIMNYESQLRRQRDVNRLLNTQLSSLQKKVKTQQEEIEENKKNSCSSSELSGQLVRLQELEEIKAILEDENDQLGSKLQLTQQALELEKQANQRHEQYKIEVDEKMRVLDIRNSDMMTDVAVLMKERDNAIRVRDDNERAIEKLNEEKENLLELKEESEKSIASLEIERNRLVAEMDEKNSLIQHLENDVEGLKTAQEETKMAMCDLHTDRESLRHEQSKKDGEFADFIANISDLESQIESLKKAKGMLEVDRNQVLSEKEDERALLMQSLSELQQKYDDGISKNERMAYQLEKLKSDYEDKISMLRVEVDKLKRCVGERNAILSTRDKELDTYRKKIQELMKRICDYEIKLIESEDNV